MKEERVGEIGIVSFYPVVESAAMDVTTALASLGTGLIVGLIFTAFKLPLPAPPVFAGIMGIFGIWAGSQLWPHLLGLFTK